MRPEGVLLSITDNDMKLKGWRGYVIGTKGCTVRPRLATWLGIGWESRRKRRALCGSRVEQNWLGFWPLVVE